MICFVFETLADIRQAEESRWKAVYSDQKKDQCRREGEIIEKREAKERSEFHRPRKASASSPKQQPKKKAFGRGEKTSGHPVDRQI